MAISFNRFSGPASQAASGSNSFTVTSSTGNFLALVIACDVGVTILGVTDNKGNTWALDPTFAGCPAGNALLALSFGAATGVTSVTVSSSGSGGISVGLYDLGSSAGGALGAIASNSGSSGTPNASVTAPAAGIVIGVASNGAAITSAGGGYTLEAMSTTALVYKAASSYKANSTSGSQTVSYSPGGSPGFAVLAISLVEAVPSNFLFLDDKIFGWLYDPSLVNVPLLFKFTSVNQSGLMEQSIANVTPYPFTPTGAQLGLLMPAHSTYAPTSNPLTAIDAGSSATIDVAAFYMRVPGVPDIAEDSGAITGLEYQALYYVYFDDPGFAGGAVTYMATKTKQVAIQAAGRFFVGSIVTPAAGGSATVGNGDGGSGSQTETVSRTPIGTAVTPTASGSASVSNAGNVIDGDETTFAQLSVNGTGSGSTAEIQIAAPNFTVQSPGSVVFKVIFSVPTNTLNGSLLTNSGIITIIPGGGSPSQVLLFGTVADGGTRIPTALQSIASIVPLAGGLYMLIYVPPAGQNLNAFTYSMAIALLTNSSNTSGTLTVNIYEAWWEPVT
jgi:hypothetical protein